MTKATQFLYPHRDLVTMMLREAEIHEGYWQLIANFRLGVGNVGASPQDAMPTGMVSFAGAGIQKFDRQEGQELPPLTYDAAELNPRKQKTKPD